MPRYMKQADAITMAKTYFPSFLRSRAEAIRLSKWVEGRQAELHAGADGALEVQPDDPTFGQTFLPKAADINEEYENLQSLAPNAFAGLVVRSVSQTAYVEGIRRPGIEGSLPVWDTFRRNRWTAKQSAIHQCAIGMAQAYGVVIPGKDPLTGAKRAKMQAKSPKVMAAFYDNDDDEWCQIAIEATPRFGDNPLFLTKVQTGWDVLVYDAYANHRMIVKSGPLAAGEEEWTYVQAEEHGMPVPPVARCANRLDLDGHATGEIEPILPLLRRLDQDVFDRLIVQRFGAWQVRYIAGMAKPTSRSDQVAQALKLRVEDLLVSSNHETKFGVLPGSPISPQIEATDADLRLLSAISQTPPHHLLGVSSNLQAEALAAASEGLYRKSFDFRTNAGVFHEQMARLVAMAEGDMETANAFDMQVRWRDTETISFSQAADALGKLATQLKVPIEMLWEKIPNWTDDDVERAKELVENGQFEQVIQSLLQQTQTPAPGQQDPTQQQQQQQGAPSGNGA